MAGSFAARVFWWRAFPRVRSGSASITWKRNINFRQGTVNGNLQLTVGIRERKENSPTSVSRMLRTSGTRQRIQAGLERKSCLVARGYPFNAHPFCGRKSMIRNKVGERRGRGQRASSLFFTLKFLKM